MSYPLPDMDGPEDALEGADPGNDPLLADLTEPQRAAVQHTEGPLLVVAAAGSGKTRTITRRIAYLVRAGIPPWSILALTFTNKAAAEMRERVMHLLSEDPRATRGLTITTFHALCARLLRRYAEVARLPGIKHDFTIYDTADQSALVKKVLESMGLSSSNWPPRSVLSAISNAKNDLLDAASFAARSGDFYSKTIAKVYEGYEKALRAANAVDFDDLLLLTANMLKANREVREELQQRWQYLQIDEYQDTNKAQFVIASLLAGEGQQGTGPNICVVGDPDQCLPPGTQVATPSGPKAIETFRDGDMVVASCGWGRTHSFRADKVMQRSYSGPLLTIRSGSGAILRATPNHIGFAKLRADPDLHYTYLMWKRGIGYRIGTTRGVRASKDGEIVSGLQVRANQEVADAMWILHTSRSSAEARYYEQLYSVRYGIPSMVFYVRGRRMDMTQEWIDRLFRTVDSEAGAERLMQDLHLSRAHPHHRPGAVTRLAGPNGKWARRLVHCTLFGDGRRLTRTPWCAHRVQLVTSDPELRAKAEASFAVRAGVRGTWRIETSRRNYDDAHALAGEIVDLDPEMELVVKARLTADRAFRVMPVSHIHPGMIVPLFREGEIVESIVEMVEWEQYHGPVYDLSVPDARNYIADGIVVHNSIYAWRGADITNILDFEKQYPSARTITLGENFRSTAPILAIADTLIRHNIQRKHKDLFTCKPGGEKALLILARDEQHEASLTVDWFRSLKDGGLNWRDMAVFYRTNALSRVMEDALRAASIPYIIARGTAFYDREEVKNAIAYLRIVANPADEVSLRRIINTPTRGIGDASLAQLEAFAAGAGLPMMEALRRCEQAPGVSPRARAAMLKFVEMVDHWTGSGAFMGAGVSTSLSELVERIITESTLRKMYQAQAKTSGSEADAERLDNLDELISSAHQFELEYDPSSDPANFPGAVALQSSDDTALSTQHSAPSTLLLPMLRGYLESISLVADSDAIDPAQGAVLLMTLHAAKGLEFPAVAMIGLEEGILPHSRARESEADLEEERRLCFVGITRAMQRLHISSAKYRTLRGISERTIPSRFLTEFGRDHLIISDQSDALGSLEDFTDPHPPHSHDDYDQSSRTMRAARDQISTARAGAGRAGGKFPVGSMVRHPQFGIGKVLSITTGANARAQIQFRDVGTKTLVLEYARLQPLGT
jgi:DNA helicase II / ATP-dependent DNA helicase PcrA